MGQRPRSFSYMLHLDSGSRTLHFSHATLSLVSLSVSLVSLVSPSARSPRGGTATGTAPRSALRGGAALELAVDVDATLFSHTHSIQPAQRTCPKYSPARAAFRVPRDPGPYLVAAGRASTLSHILSKSPCCTPYSLRGPTPVGNAPRVRAVGRAMAGVANS